MPRLLFLFAFSITMFSAIAQRTDHNFSIRIVDNGTEQPIEAKIDIFDSLRVNLDTTVYYFPDTGFTPIQYDRKKLSYIEVRAYGYKRVEMDIDPMEDISKLVVYAEEVLPMGNFYLSNVYFSSGESKLDEVASLELDKLADLLLHEPQISLTAVGHTDDKGAEQYNQELGLQRAEAVKNYLVEKGVATERIEILSMGETAPASSNKTMEERQINRRVEFRIYTN